MYKSASERIFDLQLRLASLRQVIASEHVVDPDRYSKAFYVADAISNGLEKAPKVKVLTEGTSYSSLTGAQFKKAMVGEIAENTAKMKRVYAQQNESIKAKIEALRNRKGMRKREKEHEIRVQEGMFIDQKSFDELDTKLREFKKIKVRKSSGAFIVSK